jgi:uncharacterized membrane protein
VFTEGEGSIGLESWQLALGLSLTLLAMGFVGRLAKQAIDEVEAEEAAKAQGGDGGSSNGGSSGGSSSSSSSSSSGSS